ncbi:hypothetical protein [Succinivibrio dextrinosolvens]|jgi:hypothetical protein|uniref:hypothetical protein n=1 Tax=Succinivibrio dextrinosolvens TaxID=83771 RepID=UPI00241F5524|nr:hypothetical protein [Succinivibrio dextrinosolvens]MBE6423061.1 hypothetical protein [Succinivibrio dextrinosolvens]
MKNNHQNFSIRFKQPKIKRDENKIQEKGNYGSQQNILKPFLLQCTAGIFGYFFVTCIAPKLTEEKISYICIFAILSLLYWISVSGEH